MRNRFVQVFCLGIIFTCGLSGQNFGEITGTVTDQSGAVMVGSTITITSAATNQVRRVVTNENGAYSAPYLVPGVYNVVVTNTGFKSADRPGVDLQVGAGSSYQLRVWKSVMRRSRSKSRPARRCFRQKAPRLARSLRTAVLSSCR